jgi:recombinational DNA repair protein RecR
MPAAIAGPEIERLIQLLARLPGLGPRSARRAALFLIKKREMLMTRRAVQTVNCELSGRATTVIPRGLAYWHFCGTP